MESGRIGIRRTSLITLVGCVLALVLLGVTYNAVARYNQLELSSALMRTRMAATNIPKSFSKSVRPTILPGSPIRSQIWKQSSDIGRSADPAVDIKAVQSWLKSSCNPKELPKCLQNLRAKNEGRRICVIVNPTSGSRSGLKVLEEKVLPMFKEAGIANVEVVETQSRFSVPEQVAALDLNNFDDLLVIGGDGTLCGVYLGLGQHPDPDSLSFPVGLLPCGSHNHMFKVMSEFKNVHSKVKDSDLVASLIRVCKRETTSLPVPLVKARNGDKHSVPFMCGLSFALLAAAFETSEKLRWTGLRKIRYYASILWQIMRMKGYRYTVRYLPATSNEEPPEDLPLSYSNEWVTETGPYQWLGFSPLSFGVPRQQAINDRWGFLMIIENEKTPLGIIRTILKPKLDDWNLRKNARLEKVKAVCIEPLGPDTAWNVDGEKMPNFRDIYVRFSDAQATFVG